MKLTLILSPDFVRIHLVAQLIIGLIHILKYVLQIVQSPKKLTPTITPTIVIKNAILANSQIIRLTDVLQSVPPVLLISDTISLVLLVAPTTHTLITLLDSVWLHINAIMLPMEIQLLRLVCQYAHLITMLM